MIAIRETGCARKVWVRTGCVLCLLAAMLAHSRAFAQSDDDQVIADPELAAAPSAASTPSEAHEDVIADPELASSTPDSSSSSAFTQNNTGQAQFVLRTRFAGDLYRADPREEIWENVTVAVLDVTLRRSEDLRFVLGVRARYRWSALAHNVPDARANRFELDAAPTTSYLDVNVANGLHVQLGYQPVHLGRFDLLSATNVLAVSDLREGSAIFPELGEVGQLSARIDYDVSSWLSLRLIYIPFFTPHIISVSESDYALFHQNQASVDASLGMLGLTNAFAANLTRSDREHIAETTLAAFAPEPTFSSQQAAFRATMHGTAGEIGITAATALEHLPSFRTSQDLIDATVDPESVQAGQRLAANPKPITVEYNRFALFSIDGSIDIAPVQIGVELAYMLHRTNYALGRGAFPLDLPQPDTSDMAQAGLRVEYTSGTEWLVAVESYFTYAMRPPSDPQRVWMFLEQGRYAAGVGGVLAYASEFGLGIELGAVGLTGPSVVFMPRLTYAFWGHFEIEAGVLIVDGRTPPPTITPNLAIGGLYDTVDMAFVGLRYSP